MSTPVHLFWVPLQSCWCDYRGWWLWLHNSIKLIYCPEHGGRRKSLSPFSFPAALLHSPNISRLKLLPHPIAHIFTPSPCTTPLQSIKVTSRGLRQTGSVEQCYGKKKARGKQTVAKHHRQPSKAGGLGAVPGLIGLGIVSGWGEDAFLQAWMVEGCGRSGRS